MTYVARQISVTIQLANNTQTNQPNTFNESGTNSVTITGLRTQVRIQNSGSAVGATAQIKIWGLTPSLINQLATLGLVFNLVPKNIVTISAGDAGATPSIVYSGLIWSAYLDPSGAPDTPFVIECLAGADAATISVKPTSYQGDADVATVMSGLARAMNMGFENNGVKISINNLYLAGNAKQQADTLARWAGITIGYVRGNVLAIWPRGGNRQTSSMALISPKNGMILYPGFTQQGIIVRTIFSPLIDFGQLVQVQSSLLSGIASAQAASAPQPFPTTWAVNKLDLALDSLLPRGEWASTIYAYNPNYSKLILPSL